MRYWNKRKLNMHIHVKIMETRHGNTHIEVDDIVSLSESKLDRCCCDIIHAQATSVCGLVICGTRYRDGTSSGERG